LKGLQKGWVSRNDHYLGLTEGVGSIFVFCVENESKLKGTLSDYDDVMFPVLSSIQLAICQRVDD